MLISPEQGGQDLQVGLVVDGEFDADDVVLHDGEAVEVEDLAGEVGVVDDEAGDGEVDGVDDAEGDDAEVVAFEEFHQVAEAADSVLQEDAELSQAGPVASFRGFGRGGDLLPKSCGISAVSVRAGHCGAVRPSQAVYRMENICAETTESACRTASSPTRL